MYLAYGLSNKDFDSWEKMLVRLGNKVFDRYRWAQYSDEELKTLVEVFIKENGVYYQRNYERVCGVNNMPSLSTLKKRYEDVRFLFRKSKSPDYVTDFDLLLRLKNEIIRLDMVDHLSMTYFREHYDRTYLPSVDTIMRRTNKNWEELMFEIGYDYRKIKIEKLVKNLR